jgi:nicotinate-nucleotide pyrophosphorylase (carboxylating)
VIPNFVLDQAIDRALAEDLAAGDLTTEATVDPNAVAIARAVAKSRLVACGADVFARTFYRLEPGARVEAKKPDGSWVEPGETLWIVEGSAQAILQGERTALNFVQRLSGIATSARQFVEAVPAGTPTRITDTRKTTPGLRALERYAVRVGGAHNHRDNLGAAILIKENHIALAGGIQRAVELARTKSPHSTRIEVEVRSLAELDQALQAAADIVMLDNFSDAEIPKALERVAGRALVEVSGGITLERVPLLAKLGVDIVSVGALTHSARAADISLLIEPIG